MQKENNVCQIWPEHAAPASVLSCSQCELCSQRTRVIWGEGNPNAPVIVILDNPGAREDKDGVPYVCPTRQSLQAAASRAGIGPRDLYITYLLKCRPVRKYDKPAARSACFGYLTQQLEAQRPLAAFCLGNTAVRGFFGDPEAEVKNLRGTWHEVRGLQTLVSYHPLAVRRRPNLVRQYDEDWLRLAEHLCEMSKTARMF